MSKLHSALYLILKLLASLLEADLDDLGVFAFNADVVGFGGICCNHNLLSEMLAHLRCCDTFNAVDFHDTAPDVKAQLCITAAQIVVRTCFQNASQ